MKHTKGPWKVQDESADGLFRIIPSNKKEGLAITGTLKNAQLIAAAPELLEQLKDLVRYLKAQGNTDLPSAEEVIAKAEGKKL